MTNYYIFRNGSHSYGFYRPLNYSDIFNNDMDEHLAQLYLHRMKIKPLRVNCTVAPFAEGCPLANTTTSMFNRTQLFTHSLSNNYFTDLAQQYRQTIIISLILVFMLLLLLTFIVRRLLSNKTKSFSPTSLLDSKFLQFVSCVDAYTKE
ncbi:hypothetical protein I4U23_000054 [Adineta vaga]|nr:hypothetical protein I4U23_000054 [Adineta vaga]